MSNPIIVSKLPLETPCQKGLEITKAAGKQSCSMNSQSPALVYDTFTKPESKAEFFQVLLLRVCFIQD